MEKVTSGVVYERRPGCPSCGAPYGGGKCAYCGQEALSNLERVGLVKEPLVEKPKGGTPQYLRLDEKGALRFSPVVTDRDTDNPKYHNYEDSINADLNSKEDKILLMQTERQKLTARRNDDETITFRMEISTQNGQKAVDSYLSTSVGLDIDPKGCLRITPISERSGSGIAPRDYAKNPVFKIARFMMGIEKLPEDYESTNYYHVDQDKLVIENTALDLSTGKQYVLQDLVNTSALLMARM